MEKQTTRTSNVSPETTGTQRPQWWNDKHTSTWDRVKAALQRDWEQTKADFSSDRPDLNQEIGDTLKQSAGKQPIPPLSVKTRPDDPHGLRLELVDVDRRGFVRVEAAERLDRDGQAFARADHLESAFVDGLDATGLAASSCT